MLEFRTDKEGLKIAKQEIADKYYEIPSQWQSDLGDNYLENLDLIFKDYMKIYKDTPFPQVTEKPISFIVMVEKKS
jgi:hypothetical protein